MDIEKSVEATAELAKTNSWTSPTKLELDTNNVTGSQSSDAHAPTNSNNPRFWPKWKKRRVLFVLCVASLLTDWGMTWGSPLFAAQAVDWNMTPNDVGRSLSGGVFLQGAGGLFAVPLTQRYGRLPVLFWSQFLSCVVVIGAALAPGYAGFTAARTVQGLVNTAPQIIGLSIIHDMYSFHDRTKKINIWTYSFLVGPFIGPFVSGLIITKLTWREDFGILSAMYGFSFILTMLLGDETLYDEGKDMGEINKQQPERKALITQQALLVAGVAGAKEKGRPNVLTVLKHTISIGVRPHVLIISLTYYMFYLMWAVGLATTIPLLVLPPPYSFSETSTALLYLAPAIGGLVGEVWGHFFNDHLCRSYLRKHNNEWLPEQRLWAVYPAVAIGICALVLIGQSLQNGLPWIALAFGWGMYSAATVISSTVTSAYILDCFPKHSALASSIINFWRTTGGFSVVYFQFKWIALNGAAIVFGCQAGIVAAGFLGVVATQIWGPRWRSRYPPPPAEN